MRRLNRVLRAVSVVLCGLALLLGTGVAVHAADGPGSEQTPPSQPGDPFNGATLAPGDTFVVTPSDGATGLGDPVDPEVVQSHVDADADGTPDAATSASPSPSGTAGPDGAGSADPDDPDDPAAPQDAAAPSGEDAEESSSPAWWIYLVGAAALAALGAAAWRIRASRTGTSADESPQDAPEA